MKPQYAVTADSPLVIPMDNNRHMFGVSVRTAVGQTVEVALEDITDPVTAPNSPGPVWLLAAASSIPNFYKISTPVRLLRITGAGTATVLEQGFEDEDPLSIQEMLFKNGEPGYYYSIYDPNSLYPRRNLLTYTSEFDNAIWTKIASATVLPNQIAAPDGRGLLADLLTAGAGSNSSRIQYQYALQAGLTYPIRLWIKQGTTTTPALRILSPSSAIVARLDVTFDAGIPRLNNTAGTIDPLLTPDVDGWFLLTGKYLATETGNHQFAIYIDRLGTDANLYAYGAQLGIGETQYPYQPVTDWTTEYLANAPIDKVTMWQESSAETPVMKVGDPIGYVLDRRLGYSLGANIAPALEAANWTVTNADSTHIVTWGVGSFRYQSDTTSPILTVQKTLTLTTGKFYEITVTTSAWTSGSLKSDSLGGGGKVVSTGVGIVVVRGVANTATLQFVRNSTNVDLTISGIQVKEVLGNHANQPTAASRWILQALYNKFIKTEQLADAVSWPNSLGGTGVAPIRTANYAAAPNGTMTAARLQFSIGAGVNIVDQSGISQAITGVTIGTPFRAGVWLKATNAANVGKKVGIRHAAAAGYLIHTLTSDWALAASTEVSIAVSVTWSLVVRATTGTDSEADLLAWGADLRPLDDVAPGIPPYQRVNTPTDYDTVGFPHYGQSDGVDDDMRNTIDLTVGGNHFTSFVTQTHQSDAAQGNLFHVPSSALAILSNPRSSSVLRAVTGGGGSEWRSAVNPAPETSVITSVFNSQGATDADRLHGYRNGSDAGGGISGVGAVWTWGSGTGYFGRQSGSAVPFNGRIYSYVGRLSTTPLDPAVRRNVEQILAAAAGLTI